MPDKPELLSISAYAARVGVNKSTISRQVTAGKIPVAGHDKQGRPLLDPAKADAARAGNLNPLMARNVPPADERIAALPDPEPEADDEGDDEPDLLSAGERRSPAQPSKSASLTAAHAADKSLAALQRRLAIGKEIGELMSAAEVLGMFQTMGRTFRDRLQGFAVDVAPVVLAAARDGTEATVRAALQERVRVFLDDLTNEFERDYASRGDSAAADEMADGESWPAGGSAAH